MTAVNFNSAGSIKQLMQTVSVSAPASAARKESARGDFEAVMNSKVGEKAEKTDKSVRKGLEAKNTAKDPDKAVNEQNNGNKSSVVKTANQEDSQPIRQKDNVLSESKASLKDKNGNLEEELTEDIVDVNELSMELMAGIMQILDCTPEEFEAALDNLNLEMGDLTDKNNVSALVLYMNGSSELSDMLVDNGMLETYNKVNDFVAQTLQDAGVTVQDFKEMLLSAGQEETTVPEEETAVLSYEAPRTEEEDRKLPVQDRMEAVSNETEQDESEPLVTVVRHRDENSSAKNDTGSGTQGEDGETEADSAFGKEETTISSKTVRTNTASETTVTENFVQRLETAALEAAGDVPENVPDMREIVYQVVERIRVDISTENTSMEMRLNPENLGRVSINITSKEGVMTAQINTENRAAREAIESQLQILKDNIEAKGIRVEAVEVRVADFNFTDSRNSESNSDEYGEAGRGGRRRNGSISMANVQDDAEAERLEEEVLAGSGSTVSYRA